MTGKIPVLAAKTVAHQYGLKQCLLIGFDGEFAHVVTYGRTKADCAPCHSSATLEIANG